MDIYDKMCFTVSSAGGRRGAQMGTFDVGHPDAMEFIRAKRENGRLRQFNLSLLITDEFMQAVREDREWKLAFPLSQQGVRGRAAGSRPTRPSSSGASGRCTTATSSNDDGLVACKIYKTLPARRMWDVIMTSTYDFAEPGFILIDRVNEMNNNWWCENIRATNPCGEQPLPPYGSCLLGSVNLTRFVRDPFTEFARVRLGRVPRGRAASSRACSTTSSRSTACRSSSSATRSCASAATAWASSASAARITLLRHEVRLARVGAVHRGRLARDGGGRLGSGARAGDARRARRRS